MAISQIYWYHAHAYHISTNVDCGTFHINYIWCICTIILFIIIFLFLSNISMKCCWMFAIVYLAYSSVCTRFCIMLLGDFFKASIILSYKVAYFVLPMSAAKRKHNLQCHGFHCTMGISRIKWITHESHLIFYKICQIKQLRFPGMHSSHLQCVPFPSVLEMNWQLGQNHTNDLRCIQWVMLT